MTAHGVDPLRLRAWLAGRSAARGLPPPVSDRGGFRVDTDSAAEICRWIFADALPGLADIARSIHAPGHLIKLCGTAEALADLVPPCWRVEMTGWVMVSAPDWPGRPLPEGYVFEVRRAGAAFHARILTRNGSIAANGWAAETDDVFVYDRIVTEVAHRRRGIGGALMSALRAHKRDRSLPEMLVATPDGRALYEKLGWRVISPYSTASI